MRSRLLVLLAAVTLTACVAPGPPRGSDALGDDALTIGSFNFPESVMLGELYAQAIEAQGIRVTRRFDIGPRELVEPALQRGLIELVPEYAGSLLEFIGGGPASSDLDEVRSALVPALEKRGLVAFESANAQNRNAFAVSADLSRSRRVVRLSDLAGVDGLALGGPPECLRRPLCRPGLEETYGITFESFVPLDQGGPITAEALIRGFVDVGLIFTTSPEVLRSGLVLLEDDRHLQPAEHVTPIAHHAAVERFGSGLADAVDAVSASLTTAELRLMNDRVEIAGLTPAEVARSWLTDRGLVAGEG
ncbi:MAG TPA: ABC transporter substrate-binding protein [Actinomycetota bacterium]|nr:ABC transporter substrate-binding protein [Actinomycetota bacterium]